MLLRKLLPLPLLAAGLVLVATVPFLGSKARSSQEIVSPKVMVTHLEMEYLTGRSARIDMELNVHNPNDLPMDMNINLELLARNSTGDAQFISLGSLTAVDMVPRARFWEFTRTEGGGITLRPLRYHPLDVNDKVFEAFVPPELRPSGRDELFPYLYDNMDKFGFMGAVGQVEMLVLGEAGFLAGDETVVVLVEEHIMVPFPYRY